MNKGVHRKQQACFVLVDGLASADGIHKLRNAATLPCQDGLRARPRTMLVKPQDECLLSLQCNTADAPHPS